jgi:hypothetical protein
MEESHDSGYSGLIHVFQQFADNLAPAEVGFGYANASL